MKNLAKRCCAMALTIALVIGLLPVFASAADTVQYRYHRYIDDNGNVAICPYYGNDKFKTNSMRLQYSEWMGMPLKIDNGKWTRYDHPRQGANCENAGCIDPTYTTARFVDGNGTYWYCQEARTVNAKGQETGRIYYRYHHYTDDNGNINMCPKYGNEVHHTNSMHIEYTDWLKCPLPVNNGKWSCYTHIYRGDACDAAGCVDVSCDSDRYIDIDSRFWFYEETWIEPVEVPEEPTEPEPTEPTPTEPRPTEPWPTEPKPTEPWPTEPKPTEPWPTEPTPTESRPTEPEPTEPKPMEPNPTESKPTEPKPAEPTPTEPKPAEPETQYVVSFQEEPGDDVLDQISENLYQYAIDLAAEEIDALTPVGSFDLLKEILSYKDCAKLIVTAVMDGEIGESELRSAIYQAGLNIADLDEADEEIAAAIMPLVLDAAAEDPALAHNMVKMVINKVPQLFLKICLATAERSMSFPLKAVVAAWRASSDAYTDLLFACAELRSIGGSWADTILLHSEEYMKSSIEDYALTYEAAALDGAKDETENLEGIRNLNATLMNCRQGFLDSIAQLRKKTFLFAIWHPIRNGKLKDLEKALEQEPNLEEYYWEVWNETPRDTNDANKIVEIAQEQLDKKAGAAVFQDWAGLSRTDPWCAAFASWAADQSGYISEGTSYHFVYCPYGMDWFKNHNRWLNKGETPEPGMIIFYDWINEDTGKRNGEANHVGIVVRVENGRVYTIEGNRRGQPYVSSESCRISSPDVLGYGIPYAYE